MTKPSIRDIYLAVSQANFESKYADLAPSGAMVVAKPLETVRAILKGIDGSSEDSTRGLAVGLVGVLDSFSLLDTMPDGLDEEHLGNVLIIRCDEEFMNGPEDIIDELLLWYPTHAPQLNNAKEDGYSAGIALALYIIHTWLQATYKKEYDITDLHGGLADTEMPEPQPAYEVGSGEPIPGVDEPKISAEDDPVMDLFSKISTLCDDPDVSFRFEYLDNDLFVNILFSGDANLGGIQAVADTFGENNARLISRNDVISILVKPF